MSSPGYDSSAQALSPEYQDVFLDVAREGLYISNNKTLKYTNLCQRGKALSVPDFEDPKGEEAPTDTA